MDNVLDAWSIFNAGFGPVRPVSADDFFRSGERFAAYFNPSSEVQMNIKRNVVMALAAVVVAGAGGLAGAAEPGQAAKPGSSMSGMGDMSKGHGKMGSDGTMGGGMMDMMHSCQKTMGGTMSGGAMMPQLPPGNEKLEFQMHAEMMQKVGEIAARYADKIKEAK